MKIISHRGGSGEYNESSFQAFFNSSFIDVDGIECDIHFSKDDIPVINHNPTLLENHKINEFIENLNFEEILTLTDNKVILLSDLLEIFNPKQELFLEIKGNPNNQQLEILNNILKNSAIKNNIIILSYNTKILKNINDYKKLVLIDNIFPKKILSEIINFTKSNYIGIYYDIVSLKYIQKIKNINNNIKIFIFTVNENIIFKKFIDQNIYNLIDGIITDYPNKFLKLLKNY